MHIDVTSEEFLVIMKIHNDNFMNYIMLKKISHNIDKSRLFVCLIQRFLEVSTLITFIIDQ